MFSGSCFYHIEKIINEHLKLTTKDLHHHLIWIYCLYLNNCIKEIIFWRIRIFLHLVFESCRVASHHYVFCSSITILRRWEDLSNENSVQSNWIVCYQIKIDTPCFTYFNLARRQDSKFHYLYLIVIFVMFNRGRFTLLHLWVSALKIYT